ncbi:hypothetical protein Tco_0924611 [Tanacetum coccineum]|uniref:Uncharacterized protein n=1 Tax=Tanacetum coccineum TaxID=301880 RepID=A0ABQ5D5S2_9ASTR
MAQQIILATQLVPKFQGIGRCNNYVVFQSIPCSPECKIVGQILLDYPLSYSLTIIAYVLAMYLQQLWKTFSKVPDTKDTIRFKLDTQDIIYNVDMFRDTLKLSMDTPDNLFVAPINIEIIESFMHTVSYQGVVDKKKDVIQYPRFTKLIISDLMKKYPSIPLRLEEDYHSIKDDILLVSVYTTGNVTVRGMLIPDAFLTKEIRDDYKDYETGKKRKQSTREISSPTSVPPPSDEKEIDEIAEATLLSLTLHKTVLADEAQEKLEEEEIEKMVKVEEDKESYTSEFVDSMFNNNDDFGTRIKPESHTEDSKVVDDDEVNDKEKQDEKKDDDAEK